MVYHRRSILAAISLVAGVRASGSIDNSADAEKIKAAAVSFDGTYKISNPSSGASLVYMHNDQPNMFPTTNSVESLLEEIKTLFSQPTVDDTFTLIPSSSDNSVMIANTDSEKAIAAQWNFDTDEDGYAVAYAYGSSGSGTLEEFKQWWYFYPCGSSSSSSSSDSSSSGSSSFSDKYDSKYASSSSDDSSDDTSASAEASATETASSSSGSSSACPKPADWVYRHASDADSDFIKKHPECEGTGVAPTCAKDGKWLSEHSSYIDEHEECKSVLSAYSSRMGKRAPAGHRAFLKERKAASSTPSKRGSSTDGTYCIVAKDHIDDMTTKAISATEATAFGDAKSALMDYWDETDDAQVWEVVAA